MKVWITKYALSTGIMEEEGETCDSINPNMLRVNGAGNNYRLFHGEGKDWHRSKEGAIHKANIMRLKKIRSLESQIVKFRNLNY